MITRASDDPKRPQNFWDFLGVIPIFWDDPNISGAIWGQSQKIPKNPKANKKIGFFWDENIFWGGIPKKEIQFQNIWDDFGLAQKIWDFLGSFGFGILGTWEILGRSVHPPFSVVPQI